MKIAIIGAGFTGLSAGLKLSEADYQVTIFEKNSFPGGLAVGFKDSRWQWTLEKHYHHWFANDRSAFNLAKKNNYKIITKRPKTSVYVEKKSYQLDSPINILTFPKLSIFERLRMGTALAFIRYLPFWKILEGIPTDYFLRKFMGKNPYKKIWEPQLKNKFGEYTKNISLAWFWARIKKRTPKLAYPEGGFLNFANNLIEEIKKKGGKIFLNTEVTKIARDKDKVKLFLDNSSHQGKEKGISYFDKVIITLPSFSFLKICKDLPTDYQKGLSKLKSLGVINLVLILKEQFLKDKTYWLSICDKGFPFIAIIEHTNYMDSRNYNNEHIVYVGKYLPHDHKYMDMTAKDLLKIFDPYLKKINPNYKSSLIDYHLFKDSFAQPIIPINYSKIIPPFETPMKNVYLANMQQVYPWDRGTNYAVELGEKVADSILKS